MSPASRSLRIVFVGATVIVVALLAVFAYSLASSQSRQRRDLEKRFHDRATVSAALIDAIFSISSTQTQGQATPRFGGADVSQAVLERTRRQSQALYLEIVDSTAEYSPGHPARRSARARPGLISTRP